MVPIAPSNPPAVRYRRSFLVPGRAHPEFLPWSDLRSSRFRRARADLLVVRQRATVGLGVAWTLGLLTDAGNGVLLASTPSPTRSSLFSRSGRRAASSGSRRPAALHVAALLLVGQATLLLVRLAAAGASRLVGHRRPLTRRAALAVVSWVLLIPQRPPRREHML